MPKKTYAKLIRGNVHYCGTLRFDRDVEVEVTPAIAKTLKATIDTIIADGEKVEIKRFEISTKGAEANGAEAKGDATADDPATDKDPAATAKTAPRRK